MSKHVVVVESPAKAKTINKYLGNDYTVLASYGHIRDLPSKNGSVDPNQNFLMIWEIEERSEKHIKEIVKAVKNADTLYLATDPDREGEAISWHVQQVLEERKALNKVKTQRIVFYEITKNAVNQALKAPRPIDKELVQAYLARRALDYLVGFTLSPVLWRKLPGARSAGRVQSVALRLIVEREQQIENFKSQEYWTISVHLLTEQNEAFEARLTHFQNKKLEKLEINNETLAHSICDTIEKQNFIIDSIEKKQVKRNPSAPFITSTLQQEAARKLGFSASRTMQIAQRLYEGIEISGETTGLITYMRTDGVNLSKEAIEEARTYLNKTYGSQYVPTHIREFKSKAKNAQEAHEAIRPTLISRRPQEVAGYLDDPQLKLYDLIWKRTLASQMENAVFDQVGIDIISTDRSTTLRATGSTLVFDGFLKLYQEGKDDEVSNEDKDKILPLMKEKENLKQESVEPSQHFTQPPPRFTEASLVKRLEELGIGRPSTYASLLQVLQDRNYVQLERRQFVPEDRGRLVTSFLNNFFKKYVEYDFTANLEQQLDEISSGQLSWLDVLNQFWTDFHKNVEETQPLRLTEVIDKLEEDLNIYLFQGVPKEERICPTCGQGHLSLKLGKFGAFLGCSQYPDCKHTRPLGSNTDNQEMVADSEPIILGKDPETNADIHLKKGPYGMYLEWEGLVEKVPVVESEEEKPKKKGAKKAVKPKPKRVSIPAGLIINDINLETALKLKDLPKYIGVNPATDLPMTVGIGRFGPYVKHGDNFVSIPKSDNFLELDFERACEIVEAKKQKTSTSKRIFKKKKS